MAQRTTAAHLFDELAALETDDHVIWPRGLDWGGYGRVHFVGQSRRVHRLALLRRGDMPADRPMACHRPGLGCPRACMNYRHLYWGSALDNNTDTVIEGHSTKGERQPRHRLTADDVRAIRALPEISPVLCRQIAAQHGVTYQAVRAARSGKNWGWLE